MKVELVNDVSNYGDCIINNPIKLIKSIEF